ncbi:LPXTG cell wall anchor domain-containing protein [Corynebacterium riegelii]|uniref:LPXTG cell wall anchor domain-containing protein n=1 Tax=Corynebacterium riegelii TaxID=156976 RepID=UPI00191E2180|nr:LPXTG cell wall anchor domain-containing protein [Corynebacterium riegelii]QQU84269.1 LPXTG cell wall anchor domain-containing protein [Corynebacterium riegelii]
MRTASALIAAAAALALSAPAASATLTSSPAPVVLTEGSEAPELTREELIEAAIKASDAYAKKQTPETEAALREALEAWLEDVTERMDELDAERDEAGELPEELADTEAELLEERVLLRKLYKELPLDDASTHPLPTILTEANVADEEAEVTTAEATAEEAAEPVATERATAKTATAKTKRATAEPTLRQRVVTLADDTTTSTTTSETTTDTTTTNTSTTSTTTTGTSTTSSATTSGTATVLENRTTEATTTRSSTSTSSSTSSTTRTSTPTSTTSTTRNDDLAETGTPMLGLIALGALLVVGGVFLTRRGNE